MPRKATGKTCHFRHCAGYTPGTLVLTRLPTSVKQSIAHYSEKVKANKEAVEKAVRGDRLQYGQKKELQSKYKIDISDILEWRRTLVPSLKGAPLKKLGKAVNDEDYNTILGKIRIEVCFSHFNPEDVIEYKAEDGQPRRKLNGLPAFLPHKSGLLPPKRVHPLIREQKRKKMKLDSVISPMIKKLKLTRGEALMLLAQTDTPKSSEATPSTLVHQRLRNVKEEDGLTRVLFKTKSGKHAEYNPNLSPYDNFKSKSETWSREHHFRSLLGGPERKSHEIFGVPSIAAIEELTELLEIYTEGKFLHMTLIEVDEMEGSKYDYNIRDIRKLFCICRSVQKDESNVGENCIRCVTCGTNFHKQCVGKLKPDTDDKSFECSMCRTSCGPPSGDTPHPETTSKSEDRAFKLNSIEVVMLTLQYLRSGVSFSKLAVDWRINSNTASRYVRLTLYLLSEAISIANEPESSLSTKAKNPSRFKIMDPDGYTHVIDCFDIHIQAPKKTLLYNATYSQYRYENSRL